MIRFLLLLKMLGLRTERLLRLLPAHGTKPEWVGLHLLLLITVGVHEPALLPVFATTRTIQNQHYIQIHGTRGRLMAGATNLNQLPCLN